MKTLAEQAAFYALQIMERDKRIDVLQANHRARLIECGKLIAARRTLFIQLTRVHQTLQQWRTGEHSTAALNQLADDVRDTLAKVEL